MKELDTIPVTEVPQFIEKFNHRPRVDRILALAPEEALPVEFDTYNEARKASNYARNSGSIYRQNGIRTRHRDRMVYFYREVPN